MTEKEGSCLNCLHSEFNFQVKNVEFPFECKKKINVTSRELGGKCREWYFDPSFEVLGREGEDVRNALRKIYSRMVEKGKIDWPPDWETADE